MTSIVTDALTVRVATARPASPRPSPADKAQLAFGAIALGSDNFGAGETTRTA